MADVHLFNVAYDEVTCGLDMSMGTVNESSFSQSKRRLSLLTKAKDEDLKLLCKISSILHKKDHRIPKMVDLISGDDDREGNDTESSEFVSLDSQSASDDGGVRDVTLTEQERETFVTEGIPLPRGGPFTKTEERALKRIRRKIKNKLSAQESRRKKKEYVEGLEKRLDSSNLENSMLREQVSSLNNTVRSLLSELQRLQKETRHEQQRKVATQSRGTQTGTCLKCLVNKRHHLDR